MKKNILCLDFDLCGKEVKIVRLNFDNPDIICKLENIGLYKGQKIFVKDNKLNKFILHIVINDLEYALRIKDARKIEVSY